MNRTATIGMFDGVHCGHRFLLDFMKSLPGAGRPLVVTFSSHPLRVIAPDSAPGCLLTKEEKCSRLADCGCDCAMLDFTDQLRLLPAREFMLGLSRDFGVSRLVIGFNNRLGNDRADFERCRAIGSEIGMEVVGAPEYEARSGVSSSAIRKLLARGDVESAAALLGYRYSLTGTVVTGNQIGRTLGFPTANLSVDDPSKVIPAAGVYAADAVTVDGCRRRAVVNIGHRPSVDNSPTLHIEAHILGLEENLYGQPLTIEFIRYIRPERKFPDLAALRAQIDRDITAAR